MPAGDDVQEDLARDVLARSAKLSGMLAPKSQIGVIKLIRLISSYYSNRIEAETLTLRRSSGAMPSHYSADPAKRNLQKECLAISTVRKR